MLRHVVWQIFTDISKDHGT